MKLQRLVIVLVLSISLAMLGTMGCTKADTEKADTKKVDTEKADTKTADIKYDRQGLVDLMQKYVGALASHNPQELPFAENVKFTENSSEGEDVLAVGQGLWENATGGPTEFQIYAADPEAQAAACLVVMKETDKDILLGARIKLDNGKITEAEHLVVRGGGMGGGSFGDMPTLQKPRPGFAEDIPEAERMSREDLTRIGLSYYDALTSEDGTRAPFADECERRENGITTAGGTPPAPPAPKEDGSTESPMPVGGFGNIPMDCEGQLSAGVFAYITEIKPRMVVADVQKGLAVGFSMFRHDGTKRLPADAEPEADNSTQWGQFNLAALHIFKIRNGQLYEIEAPGAMLPYGTQSGWEAEEKVYPIVK